jgi:hypothetical protein
MYPEIDFDFMMCFYSNIGTKLITELVTVKKSGFPSIFICDTKDPFTGLPARRTPS